VEVLQHLGASDSKTKLMKWLEDRAKGWCRALLEWCPEKEIIMVAYDNYQKNVKARHMINGKKGTFFNGTMRVFIKAIGANEGLEKTAPIKPLDSITSDDVRDPLQSHPISRRP